MSNRVLGASQERAGCNMPQKKQEVGIIIKPDGTEITVFPASGLRFELAELQAAVGGYIELVKMKPGYGRAMMFVDEDGKYKKYQRNQKATHVANLFPFDYICGTAIIVRPEKVGDRDPIGDSQNVAQVRS